MKSLLSICLLFLVQIGLSQQYLMNSPELIQKNSVKTLTVDNCLETAICYRDQYNFNACGKVEEEFPAMVGFYVKYTYDEECELESSLQLLHGDNKDSVYSKTSYFEIDGQQFKVVFDPNNPETKSDSIQVKSHMDKAYGIREKEGLIESYKFKNLLFPCGIEFEGENTFMISYTKNGLINKADVYNDRMEKVLSLKYTYLY